MAKTDAIKPEKTNGNETQSITINLNIGLFFDGTNNNAVQSMIALHNRRQKFFKKYKKEIHNIFKGRDAYSLTRDELEKANIGTSHELDNVFGFSQKINRDIEKKIANANKSEYQYSSAAEKYDKTENENLMGRITTYFIDDSRREALNRMAGNEAKRWTIFKNLPSISTSQGSNYTNIAILNSLYKTKQETTNFYHSIYIEGSGANEEINAIRQLIKLPKSIIGLGFGVDESGVIQKCRKAIHKIKDIYRIYNAQSDVVRIDFHFDIFGFSRGATTARCFTYILNPKGTDGYVNKDINKVIYGSDSYFLDKGTNKNKKLGKKEVRALGLFDTVSSIGILREGTSYLIGDKALKISKKADLVSGKSIFHDTNVDDFGLHSTDQANAVLHICALDEYRKNFALVDIRNCTSTNGLEIYIPGCHTDIGGGSSFGLDKFKIINCDEIATRGAILYNLYVRIEGLHESLTAINNLSKNITTLSASISNPATTPVAYVAAKGFIPNLHKAIMGFFSLLNGYESIEAYRIENNQPVGTARSNMQTAGYCLIGDLIADLKSTTNSYNKITDNVNDGRTVIKSLPKQDFIGYISSATGLFEIGKNIITSLVNFHASIINIITDIKKIIDEMKKDPSLLGKDIMTFFNNELITWQNELVLLDEAIETFDLIFTGKHKAWIIPIEQRRICMYTDIPYDNDVKNNTSKKKLIKPLCIETLKEMGWLKDDEHAEFNTSWTTGRPTSDRIEQAKKEGKSILVEKTKVAHFFSRDNIGICKYTKPGYTLIALKAMHTWANKQREDMFDKFPDGAYDVPNDISNFCKQVVSQVEKKNGKVICTPNVKINNINGYKYLRQHYLHISINQQVLDIADNGIVNGPSYMTFDTGLTTTERDALLVEKRLANNIESYNKDNVITRRIYPGVQSDQTVNKTAVGGKEFVDAPSKVYYYLDN